MEIDDDLKLTSTQVGEVDIVQITGNIYLYTTPELKAKFDELNSAGRYKILLDILNVRFIDSYGLGILVTQALFLKKKNSVLKFINVNSTINHVFALGGFTRSFKRFPDKESAVTGKWEFES